MWNEFDPHSNSAVSQTFLKEYLSYFEEAQMMVKIGESKLFLSQFHSEVFHRLYYEPEPEKLEPAPPESAWAQSCMMSSPS